MSFDPGVCRVNISRPPARSHSFTSDPASGTRRARPAAPIGAERELPDPVAMTGEREPLPAGIGVEHLDHPGFAHVPDGHGQRCPGPL